MSARDLIATSLIRAGYGFGYSPDEPAPYLQPTQAQIGLRRWRRFEHKRMPLSGKAQRFRENIARHRAAMLFDPDLTDLMMRRIATEKLGLRLAISAQMTEPRPELP